MTKYKVLLGQVLNNDVIEYENKGTFKDKDHAVAHARLLIETEVNFKGHYHETPWSSNGRFKYITSNLDNCIGICLIKKIEKKKKPLP